MNYTNTLSLVSIIINVLLILIILIRSPNEQSLQQNLDPFKFFESSSRAQKSIDNVIKALAILYFLLAILYSIQEHIK